MDTAFDVGQMKIGRRLAIKLLNASKFVLGRDAVTGPVTHPLDRALLTALAALVAEATAALEAYEYTRALDRTETLLLVVLRRLPRAGQVAALRRSRRRGAPARPTRAMQATLSTLLRLFAPYLPFVTDEVWSWWHTGSVHQAGVARGGGAAPLAGGGAGVDGVLEAAVDVLTAVRRAKSEAKVGMKAVIERADVRDTPARLAALELTARPT